MRLVVVGDVHGVWEASLDEKALRFLAPDLVLFTGDFGNEDVKMVQQVSRLDMPKAVILGNHDCSWTAVQKNPKKKQQQHSPVNDELEALGNTHVGYGRMDLPHLKLSVVGARPFAMGGQQIYAAALVQELYGITDMKASAQKIVQVVKSAPKAHSLVVLAHNGPTGLGSQRDSPCGKDFEKNGGDHGDPDLEQALKECCSDSSHTRVPLVVFGHMHHKLLVTPGDRKMIATRGNTVYVNCAVVPRERMGGMQRNFTTVDLSSDGKLVVKASQCWVSVDGPAHLAHETVLYQHYVKNK